MILTKLSLENFGPFRDRCTFDLTTKDPMSGKLKPIILFGGKNGAGKTTLFEAIRLCLYGGALPDFNSSSSRRHVPSYQEFVKRNIHRSSKVVLQPVSAIVSLEFEYARLGKIDKYNIERRWHLSKASPNVESANLKAGDDTVGLSEEFQIMINGKPFEELDSSQWQDFIKELLPVGVSKLFFFDGEQIQALAEDKRDELHLKDSFYSLLGLDLVERLQTDLHIHLTRRAKESDQRFAEKLDALSYENEQIYEQIEILKQKRGDLENKIDNRRKRVQEMQDKLSLEGGTFAKHRDELRKKKVQLDVEIEEIYEHIRQLCAELLPFSFAPQYCRALKERLTKEQEIQLQILSNKQVRKMLEAIEKETILRVKESSVINKENNNKPNEEIISEIKNIFSKTYLKTAQGYSNNNDKKTTVEDTAKVKIIHHLSTLEQNKILGWIDSVLNYVPKRIKVLNDRLEKLTIDLQKTEESLRKAPSDEVIGPLINELNLINQEIGESETLLKQTDEKITQLEHKMKNIETQIKSLENEKREYEKLHRGLSLAHKVQDALQEYELQIKQEKLSQLSQSLIDCLNELMHKEIFERAIIDSESFRVTLYDKVNNAIPKEQLSAGEKQIYAIAILWALARTSGRPLPFIVDTPLGRLDSDHRLNLVQNFFPVASHQVMIFSTDTEIDQKYFEDLSEYISKSYKLEYDSKEARTKVESGYFWRLNDNNDNKNNRGDKRDKNTEDKLIQQKQQQQQQVITNK